MRTYVAIITLAALTTAAHAQKWVSYYETGLLSLKVGQYGQARAAFREVAALKGADTAGPIPMGGSILERNYWRNGAAYSPILLGAYSGFKASSTVSSDEDRTKLLREVAGELESLHAEGKASRESYYFLNQTYVALGDVASRLKLEEEVAKSMGRWNFRVDRDGFTQEDLSLVNPAPQVVHAVVNEAPLKKAAGNANPVDSTKPAPVVPEEKPLKVESAPVKAEEKTAKTEEKPAKAEEKPVKSDPAPVKVEEKAKAEDAPAPKQEEPKKLELPVTGDPVPVKSQTAKQEEPRKEAPKQEVKQAEPKTGEAKKPVQPAGAPDVVVNRPARVEGAPSRGDNLPPNTIPAAALQPGGTAATAIGNPVAGRVAIVPNKFAIIIGSSESKLSQEPIAFAQSDAQKVREALVTHAGYAEENVDLVLNATAEQIAASAQAIAERVPEGGSVFIYYTGPAVNVDGKDYLAGVDTEVSTDLSTMLPKNDLYKLFMAKGARIFAFYQVNRQIAFGRYFGSEIPMVGSIAQVQATLPGGAVHGYVQNGEQVGLFTDALTSTLAEIRGNRVPILEFGWQVFNRIRRGNTGNTGGGSRQVPTLPVLTNMASDARF